jgi:hypothetical protein
MSSDNPDINAILNRLFDELKQHIDQSIQSQIQEHVTRAIEPYTERIEQLEAANQELQTRLDDLSKKIDTLGKSTPTPTAPPQYISEYSDPIMKKIDTYRNDKLAENKDDAKKLLDYINTAIKLINDKDKKDAHYLVCLFCLLNYKNLPNEDKFKSLSKKYSLDSVGNPNTNSNLKKAIKDLCYRLCDDNNIPNLYKNTLSKLQS